jgi:2-oxoglutarate ferredoxin oxidoreductase subunit alpha
VTSFTIGIAGSGGDGVILLGELLARTAADAGLHCFLTKSFGPQIRGGETSCRLTFAAGPLHCPGDRVDLLAVLSWEGYARFSSELPLAAGAVVLCDARQEAAQADLRDAPVLALPLEHLALETAGSKQARNMVLAGALCAALNWPAAQFIAQLAGRQLRQDGADSGNARAVVAGGELAAVQRLQLPQAPPGLGSAAPLELLTGNAAVCRGALAAGCRFMAGYPISPATEILETLMRELPAAGGNCVQAEDEIAAAGLALGASYGGVRAMTATSGPGLSLKVEALGLAVMAELPLVVVDVQRVGPSTGIPTRTEQADLNIALYGRHGDAPCPVLAPVSIADCGRLTQAAFEIAEKYRTPVIILSDQYLAQGVQTMPVARAALPANNRTADTAVRPTSGLADTAAHPGIPAGLSGLVRDAAGEPSSDPALHAAMCARRAAKLEALRKVQPLVARYAPQPPVGDSADRPRLGILTWGSSYGPCCALADQLAQQGSAVSVFAPQSLYPLPLAPLTVWLTTLDELFVPELNHSGQFWRYLRSQLDVPVPATPYHRAGGRAFAVEELLEKYSEISRQSAGSGG